MFVYIILKLCVDVEEKLGLGSLVFGMAVEMPPIAYHEPQGDLSPPRPLKPPP